MPYVSLWLSMTWIASGVVKKEFDWVAPAFGFLLCTETFTRRGGNRTFTTPTHGADIAIRIKRVSQKKGERSC